MNTKDFRNDPDKAFEHGKNMAQQGKSIHYNPYRNTQLNDSHLWEQWVKGYQSILINK